MMNIINLTNYYFQLATEKRTFYRALTISLIIGLTINLVYHPEWLFSLSGDEINLSTVLLSVFIPFMIIIFSVVISKSNFKPGNISSIDALLKCNSCNKADFHVHVGQEISQCPHCKEKTKWTPKQIFSFAKSDNEILKSLALFARHNPQPLFRIDAKGIISSSNPASETLFEDITLSGQDITELLPELKQFNLNEIIENDDVKEVLIILKGKFYKLVLKGVNSIKTINIYGNDITRIKLAEQKIQTQAKDIQESISYAWTIQKAMLSHRESIKKMLPSHFIFYRPRNVVSGDFYWINQVDDFKIVVAADSTGHGVPGAFMSMLGISMLNEIILREKIIEPDLILNQLRKRIIESLETGRTERTVQDGMDIALAVINSRNNKLSFAGAFNPLILLRNNEIEKIPADEMPVGKHINENAPFSARTVDLQIGDRLYLFTDGYKDQFGGEKDKKFGMKAFKNLILETGNLPINKQHNIIEETFDDWKNGYEQVDDVLVIGVEI
ncbi:MAG: SpoIIE family protein phosphatase [Bacteroidota bacterium]|nr:SpoIIE family protein phosphatase [Bacteroidota bacterium]